MKQLQPNGFVVQDISTAMFIPTNFKYSGINAFCTFPLDSFSDKLSKSVSERQFAKRSEDGKYEILEFISDPALLTEYLSVCQQKNIQIRLLLVESSYEHEVWNDPIPDRTILGFEYCSFPADEQIVSDIDWYPPLRCFWHKLNSFGLFNSYQEAESFKKSYDKYVASGEIGDGIEEAYIMRVSVVSTFSFLKP